MGGGGKATAVGGANYRRKAVTGRALILTYHAVEAGPSPLCVSPELFRAQLQALREGGAHALTISQLVAAIEAGSVPPRTVAITFDDGFVSVVREAAPLLVEHDLRATVFCVAGHLGGANDWPTQRPGSPQRALAGASDLAELARTGFEIGSHGFEHAPLGAAMDVSLERELRSSKELLQDALQSRVSSFAYPYGSIPEGAGARMVRELYDCACTTVLDTARAGSDPHALPRVDAHYLRRPALLRRALEGSLGSYLQLRRIGARVRRLVLKDYALPQ